MAETEEMERSDIMLDMLLEKAEQQGHLTFDDVLEALPETSGSAEQAEEIVNVLSERGVEFLDGEPDVLLGVEEIISEQSVPSEFDVSTRHPSDSESDTISMYMREMSAVPLLRMEEEVSLAKRIVAGRQARRELDRMNGRNAPMKKVRYAALVEDGLLAREHLIKANTRLVVSVAKRYTGRGVPFLDLIQEGNLGLMKAVEKFDYLRGFRFSTYATWWIRQTITRSIADQGRTIRVPVHMIDRIRQLYKRTYEMEQHLGRTPTLEELSGALETEPRKVEWMLRVSWLPLSLETPISEDDEESELGNFIEDQLTPGPIQSVYAKLLSEKINEVLDSLPVREARILRMRFGLDDGHNYTLEEVGRKFGLTRERIRQLETKALRRLRHPRRAQKLREYL